jgi:hypothetical protein
MLFLFSHNLCDLIYLYFVVENVCLDYCWLCSMWFIELLVSMIGVCMCCDRDCYEYDDKSVIVFTCVFVWLNILLLSPQLVEDKIAFRIIQFWDWLFQYESTIAPLQTFCIFSLNLSREIRNPSFVCNLYSVVYVFTSFF